LIVAEQHYDAGEIFEVGQRSDSEMPMLKVFGRRR
jgi:hypothetical protein